VRRLRSANFTRQVNTSARNIQYHVSIYFDEFKNLYHWSEKKGCQNSPGVDYIIQTYAFSYNANYRCRNYIALEGDRIYFKYSCSYLGCSPLLIIEPIRDLENEFTLPGNRWRDSVCLFTDSKYSIFCNSIFIPQFVLKFPNSWSCYKLD
jgi:hypothetical protein